MYDDVYDTYQKVMGSLELNAPTSRYQEMTCDLFAERDHQSIRDDPKLTEGYVHSLGHGLGLNLHEAPWFRGKATASETDLLAPGAVVTIEPGLYYPSKGMGCRLEDTVYVRPDGTFEILADFPLDLVIPVQEI
jgi:Xaa-Pro aminopeptidase